MPKILNECTHVYYVFGLILSDESIFEKILQDNDNLKWKIVKKTGNQTIYNMEIKDSKIPVVKVVVIHHIYVCIHSVGFHIKELQ